jgi:manganese/zinc/iron transport system ATP- binding protein
MMGRYGKIGLCRRPGKHDYFVTRECLEKVSLTEQANRQISQLSCGQQQRAFIARAFAQDASIYFMDEPFAGIDMTTERLLVDLLKQLAHIQNKTVFVVHHDLHNLADHYDWIIMLNTELIAAGEVKSTLTQENIEQTFQSRDFYF